MTAGRAFAAGIAGGLAVVAIVVLVGRGGDGDSGKAAAPAPATTQQAKTAADAQRGQAPAPATGSYRGPVPILMYHVIKAPAPGTPQAELWVPAPTFKATIAALKKLGYQGVTMEQVHRAWSGGPGLPDKPVVVSFDDGYLSHYVSARPILQAAGWPGVLNLKTGNIDPKGGIAPWQVKALVAAGWEIGAHTITHADLTTLDAAGLDREVAGSKRELEKQFGVTVETFCYPAGKYDDAAEQAVKRAGFSTATTVDPGIASPKDNQLLLPRVRVNGSDSAQAVVERVRTGAGATGGGYG
ncbi:MAG: polysaccharide deacetylase family protein [Acidobacteria bacterium]|nr:polysaccharide deacetylase family protein [Acidobacteriota bacterium]